MATKKATAPKATTAKADKFAGVKDAGKDTSAQIIWDLMSSEADYKSRVAQQGPILAKREALGEKQADMARELVAIAKTNGRALSRDASAKRVSRYVKVGLAIINAPKGAKLEEVIDKASAQVRNGGKRKAQPEGKSTKSNTDKASAMLDSLLKLVAKMDKTELEQFDTAVSSVVMDAIAGRYTELETMEKVA